MGSATSTPTSSSQHVFSADAPVSFSGNLVDSLQTSPESDSTRARDLEAQIQARVASELEGYLSKSAEKLSSTSEAVSTDPYDPPEAPLPSSPLSKAKTYTEKPLLDRILEKITGRSPEPEQETHTFRPNLDTNGVAKEIDDLRQKLASRRQLAEVDRDVAKAKDDVARCLRLNDRRPLDCWEEVESFKAKVGSLEKKFVDSNGG